MPKENLKALLKAAVSLKPHIRAMSSIEKHECSMSNFAAYSARGGLSPLEWIQQYVATQAKLIMNTHPTQTVKETAYQLGFPTTANFCRYFKRATGIYPQAYKESRN